MKYLFFSFLLILSGCSSTDEYKADNQSSNEWSTQPEKRLNVLYCSRLKIECSDPQDPGEYIEWENEKTWTIECRCQKLK